LLAIESAAINSKKRPASRDGKRVPSVPRSRGDASSSTMSSR